MLFNELRETRLKKTVEDTTSTNTTSCICHNLLLKHSTWCFFYSVSTSAASEFVGMTTENITVYAGATLWHQVQVSFRRSAAWRRWCRPAGVQKSLTGKHDHILLGGGVGESHRQSEVKQTASPASERATITRPSRTHFAHRSRSAMSRREQCAPEGVESAPLWASSAPAGRRRPFALRGSSDRSRERSLSPKSRTHSPSLSPSSSSAGHVARAIWRVSWRTCLARGSARGTCYLGEITARHGHGARRASTLYRVTSVGGPAN